MAWTFKQRGHPPFAVYTPEQKRFIETRLIELLRADAEIDARTDWADLFFSPDDRSKWMHPDECGWRQLTVKLACGDRAGIKAGLPSENPEDWDVILDYATRTVYLREPWDYDPEYIKGKRYLLVTEARALICGDVEKTRQYISKMMANQPQPKPPSVVDLVLDNARLKKENEELRRQLEEVYLQ